MEQGVQIGMDEWTDRAEQGRAGQGRAGQGRAVQGKADQGTAGQACAHVVLFLVKVLGNTFWSRTIIQLFVLSALQDWTANAA